MPNKAFIKLLLSKTQLTSEQIMDLDDADALKIVKDLESINDVDQIKDINDGKYYDSEKRKSFSLYFSDFTPRERKCLEREAVSQGYSIRSTVTRSLCLIVYSGESNTSDVIKAVDFGAKAIHVSNYIDLSHEQLVDMLESYSHSVEQKTELPGEISYKKKVEGIGQFWACIVVILLGILLPGVLLILVPIVISGCEAALRQALLEGKRTSNQPETYILLLSGIALGFVGIISKLFIPFSILLLLVAYHRRCPGLFNNFFLPK